MIPWPVGPSIIIVKVDGGERARSYVIHPGADTAEGMLINQGALMRREGNYIFLMQRAGNCGPYKAYNVWLPCDYRARVRAD